jgi:PAS domain S-box-containing protein
VFTELSIVERNLKPSTRKCRSWRRVSESEGRRKERAMAAQPQIDWLAENGPKELELLFRAIVYHPSAPILLADNDRRYRDASVGASKLLGLPRDKIIGRSLDDFAAPGFRPVISERWRRFLESGEQEGTLELLGPDGGPRDIEYLAKKSVLPVRHLLVLRDKAGGTSEYTSAKTAEGSSLDQVPGWVQDYALFLLDADGRVADWYAGAERIYGYHSSDVIGQHVSILYPDDEALRERRACGRRGLACEKERHSILGQCHHHGVEG